MSKYDLDAYLKSVLNLDRMDIIQKVGPLWRFVDSRSFRRKGAVAARENGSLQYVAMLKHLGAFLETAQRPLGIDQSVFSKFQPLCENLVKKGQLDQSVLKLFQK